MWVEKTKNGKFKFIERYTDYMTGKTKKASVVLDKDSAQAKKQAQVALAGIINEKQEAIEVDNVTLSQLIEKYRIYQEATVKASTYKRNYYACETLKRILGDDVLVSRLNAQYTKDKFLATGKSPGTLNEHRTRLRAVLMWGYENDYVSNLLWFGKFKPFKDETKRGKIKDKYLEPDEVSNLLNYIKGTKCEHWYLVTKFLLQSGLRIGEFAALNTGDVSDTVISVTKTYDFINRVVTTPKTTCSIREVFVHPELQMTIKEIRTFSKKQKVYFGYPKTDIFLPKENGKHIEYYAYEKFLKESAEKKLDRKITAHTLRHTHASLLLAQGISIDTISRRLGHEDSRVTKEIYLHVTEKLKERDNKALTNVKII